MIPAAFEYHRPDSVAQAIAILSEHGDTARVIAGGHSLIPMMKLRMTSIGHLVDLQDLHDLKTITVEGGRVTIGAMVTQAALIGHEGSRQGRPPAARGRAADRRPAGAQHGHRGRQRGERRPRQRHAGPDAVP